MKIYLEKKPRKGDMYRITFDWEMINLNVIIQESILEYVMNKE